MRLRQDLQEAELEESLAEAVTTMHILTAGEEQRDTELGPTLTTTVQVEGVLVFSVRPRCTNSCQDTIGGHEYGLTSSIGTGSA